MPSRVSPFPSPKDQPIPLLLAPFHVTHGVTTIVAPPTGYTVDFNDPQRHYVDEHKAVFIAMAPLAFFCLCIKFYMRLCLEDVRSRKLEFDDGTSTPYREARRLT